MGHTTTAAIRRACWPAIALGACLAAAAIVAGAADTSVAHATPQPAQRIDPSAKAQPDLSGRKRYGKASFYAKEFAGRKMADGKPMNPRGNNAASRTLPLGTAARVTNLETGRSAVVVIQDRGPYVRGRIVDLSPATARHIGIKVEQGVANVVVAPMVVPLPNGEVKLVEAGADDTTRGDY